MKRYIYKITNSINGKMYIGCSQCPEYRFKHHIQALRRGDHTSKSFQLDFNKYGEHFEMEIIGEYEKINGRSNEYLFMEKYKTYDTEYGYNDSDGVMQKIRRLHGLPRFPWKSQQELKGSV